MRRLALLIPLVLAAAGKLPAQDTSTTTPAPPPRARLALDAGLMTGVPGFGDRGLGPYLGATVGLPAGSSEQRRWVLGASYAIVMTQNWTSPDGMTYRSAPEGFMAALGHEWTTGARRKVAFDVQWNPALTHVRTWGPQPEWRGEPKPWVAALTVASAGMRVALPIERGPMVAVTGRAYVNLHPLALAYGVAHMWPALGVSVQRR